MLLIFTLVYLINSVSGQATCALDGRIIEQYEYLRMETPINDTTRGVIGTYKTTNVIRMKIEKVEYLNATWENQTLTIFLNENFENFDKENAYTEQPYISITLHLECTKDTSAKMIVEQNVIDTNNNPPLFNNNHYDYIFGMEIPKDLALTDILPITAIDYDITNQELNFAIEDNEYFQIESKGEPTYYNSKERTTKLIALRAIKAPFRKVLNVSVTDQGTPPRTSFASITITVTTPEELEKQEVKSEEKIAHPPIFAKHLYFGHYNANHELKMEQPIHIKYGGQNDTELKQSGYDQYFKARFEDAKREKIVFEQLRSLPEEFLQIHDFITIEIEARNVGIDIPGRTALLIRLPKLKNTNEHEGCNLSITYDGYSFPGHNIPLLIFLLTVFAIVFVNIYVIIVFVNKKKATLQNS